MKKINLILDQIKELKKEEKEHLVELILNDENKIHYLSELLSKFNETEFERFTSEIVWKENVLEGIFKNLTEDEVYEHSWDMGIIDYKTKSNLVEMVMSEIKDILCLGSSEYDYLFKGTKNDLIGLIPNNINKSDIVKFIESMEHDTGFNEPLFNKILKMSPNWSINFKPFDFDNNNYLIEHLGIEIFNMFQVVLSTYTEYHRELKLSSIL